MEESNNNNKQAGASCAKLRTAQLVIAAIDSCQGIAKDFILEI